MTTTTTFPSHIESLIKDADSMGWEVVCTTKSVTVTPPAGLGKAGAKKIQFSLKPPPVAPQLRKQLVDSGFLAALAATQRLADEEEVEKGPEAAAEEKTADAKPFVCPECKKDHFTRPNTLGSHRRIVHGIVGSSQPAKKAKPAAKEAPAKKGAAKKAVPAQRKAPAAKAPADPAPVGVAVTDLLAERAAPVHENPDIAEAVEDLIHAVTKAAGNSFAPLEKTIKEQGEQITALQGFKDAVEAEVANGNQAPIQTLANIIKHGGEGFGTPKA